MRIDLHKLKALMNNPENIRNAGFAGHVDHGKTTTVDNILAYCGVIAKDLAGQALYMDFLEEEQRRGITIKTAAITLIVPYDGREYVLNLIDTPGHVDFSGKVSRALRLMDGVIIVVDAVEGIMAQTEAYLRLALEEHVRPILFINKLDRLIDELSMTPYQIQARLTEIIVSFNELIETFGCDYQKKSWKVRPEHETVLFGSALKKWGFTTVQMLRTGLKFDKFLEIYKEEPNNLPRLLPLGKLLARIIYEKVPSVITAQKYRIPYLWEGKIPDALTSFNKNDEKPAIFYISKTQWMSGKIFATGRVFAGTVSRGLYYCLNDNTLKRVDSVHLLFGSKSIVVNTVPFGAIFGAFIDAKPGQTFSSKKISGHMKYPPYIAVPVVYVAIEPKKTEDFEKLLEELKKLEIEDPNISVEINKETGEILLGGIGELHLEICIKELSKRLEIYSSEPMIGYRELLFSEASIDSDDVLIEIKSLRGEGVPLREALSKALSSYESGNVIIIEGFSPENSHVLESIIRNVLKSGPLVGEPIIGAMIRIIRKKASNEPIDLNQLLNLLAKALSSVKTVICEPYYEFEVTTVQDYVGAVTTEINRRGGKIKQVDAKSSGLIRIRGILPVRTSLGLPNTIRSITHGRAYIQMVFFDYLEASGKAREMIIKEIMRRKGLE